MSEHARTSDLPLFAPPRAPESVRAVHDQAEVEHIAFLNRVRAILIGMYGGRGQAISTDEAWQAMDRYRITLPAGCSPNLMGSLFSGWPRARATGQTIRSKREGAGGNLLRTWVIE